MDGWDSYLFIFGKEFAKVMVNSGNSCVVIDISAECK
jgi:hypothetical protein